MYLKWLNGDVLEIHPSTRPVQRADVAMYLQPDEDVVLDQTEDTGFVWKQVPDRHARKLFMILPRAWKPQHGIPLPHDMSPQYGDIFYGVNMIAIGVQAVVRVFDGIEWCAAQRCLPSHMSILVMHPTEQYLIPIGFWAPRHIQYENFAPTPACREEILKRFDDHALQTSFHLHGDEYHIQVVGEFENSSGNGVDRVLRYLQEEPVYLIQPGALPTTMNLSVEVLN